MVSHTREGASRSREADQGQQLMWKEHLRLRLGAWRDHEKI